MKRVLVAVFVAAVVSLACGSENPRRLELYPSPTVVPTQTQRIVVWTSTPELTYTPVVKIITGTPENTVFLCVSADEAVYLRPSANNQNYPVAPLPNGARLTDLGGRDGKWVFVEYDELSGWVHQDYIENCN